MQKRRTRTSNNKHVRLLSLRSYDDYTVRARFDESRGFGPRRIVNRAVLTGESLAILETGRAPTYRMTAVFLFSLIWIHVVVQRSNSDDIWKPNEDGEPSVTLRYIRRRLLLPKIAEVTS